MSNIIISKLNSIANEAIFKVKKNTPAILLTVGVAGVVTSAVMACIATTKLESIAVEAKDTLEKIDKAVNGEVELKEGEEYTEEDKKKDITITYLQTGLKIAKLYAPSVWRRYGKTAGLPACCAGERRTVFCIFGRIGGENPWMPLINC